MQTQDILEDLVFGAEDIKGRLIMNKIKWIIDEKEINSTIIENVEEYFGIKFPEDYKQCVLKNHGGSPIPHVFTIDGSEEMINNLIPFTEGSPYNMINTFKGVSDRLENHIIPFGIDPGGNLLCFDYRGDKEFPSIVFWHHEKAFLERDDAVIKVSDTFTEFLNSLYEDED